MTQNNKIKQELTKRTIKYRIRPLTGRDLQTLKRVSNSNHSDWRI